MKWSLRCSDIFLFHSLKCIFSICHLIHPSLVSSGTLISKTSGDTWQNSSLHTQIWCSNLSFDSTILQFWPHEEVMASESYQFLEKSCYNEKSPSAKRFSKPHWSKLLTGKREDDLPWCLQTSSNVSFRSSHCPRSAPVISNNEKYLAGPLSHHYPTNIFEKFCFSRCQP